MNLKLFLLSVFVLAEFNPIEQKVEQDSPVLPAFGISTCKHCLKTDTFYLYWNLDTNTKRVANLKKYGHIQTIRDLKLR